SQGRARETQEATGFGKGPRDAVLEHRRRQPSTLRFTCRTHAPPLFPDRQLQPFPLVFGQTFGNAHEIVVHELASGSSGWRSVLTASRTADAKRNCSSAVNRFPMWVWTSDMTRASSGQRSRTRQCGVERGEAGVCFSLARPEVEQKPVQ